MARPTSKEDSLRQQPMTNRILLHSGCENITWRQLQSDRVRMSDSAPFDTNATFEDVFFSASYEGGANIQS
jgi:hypothetical protein